MKKTILLFLFLFCLSHINAQVINSGSFPIDYGTGSNEPKAFEFKKQSMISLSLSDIVLTNITLRYEYLSKDGLFGFQAPFSFNAGGLRDTNNYTPSAIGKFLSVRNRIFQTGFNFNYYTNGQDKLSPFVGLSFAAGWFYYWRYSYTTNLNPNPPPAYFTTQVHEKMIGNNYSFAFHGGFLLNPWETLTFTIKAGVGLRRYGTAFPEYTLPFGLFDFSAGFKF